MLQCFHCLCLVQSFRFFESSSFQLVKLNQSQLLDTFSHWEIFQFSRLPVASYGLLLSFVASLASDFSTSFGSWSPVFIDIYCIYLPVPRSTAREKKTKAVQSGWASSAFHWIAEQSGQGLSIKSTNEWSYGTIGELCRSFFVHSSSQLVLLLWQKITIKLCQRTCIKVANTKIFHSASNNTPGLSLVAIQGWLCIRRLSAHFCCFNLIGPLSDTESWNMLKPIGSIS